MKLILLTLCLAPLASAYFTTLYWCDTRGHFTDPMMFTQQGQNSLGFYEMVLIGMDSPSEKDQLQGCDSKIATLAPIENFFTFVLASKSLDGLGESIGYIGNVTMHESYNYLLLKPFKEDVDGFMKFEAGVLNADSNGNIGLAIIYWSETEMVLRTCRNGFFGSSHAVYVFTSQVENLQDLSSECMMEAIGSLPDMHIFDLKMTPLENMKNCVPTTTTPASEMEMKPMS